MIPPPSGTIQSIRQRLLNRARERGEDFQLTLVRYGVERFLYRMSLSECAGEYRARVGLRAGESFPRKPRQLSECRRARDRLPGSRLGCPGPEDGVGGSMAAAGAVELEVLSATER